MRGRADVMLGHLAISGGLVPLYSKLLERDFSRASWRELDAAGLLDLVVPYDRFRGRSRAFRISPSFRRRFLEGGLTARRLHAEGMYDLWTGRPTRRTVKRERKTPGGNALPALPRAAMDAIARGVVNARALEAHLARLAQDADVAPAGREREAALGRYLADLRVYQAFLTQGARPVDPADPEGVLANVPAFRVQRFGRLGVKGGGMVNLSRAGKAAAYSGISCVRNFDLASSQPRILVACLDEAGLDPGWLGTYATAPGAKGDAARAVGVDVATWKRAAYPLLMGGRAPTPAQARRSSGAIVTAIRDGVGDGDYLEAYARFYEYTAEPRAVLDGWHRWLLDEYVPAHARRNNLDGKRYLTNAAGAKVAVEDLASPRQLWRLKGQLSAFVLQGREAALVHTLVTFGPEYGYETVSHEHDGVVTLGEVPQEAVVRSAAAAQLPLELVELVEKPFERPVPENREGRAGDKTLLPGVPPLF